MQATVSIRRFFTWLRDAAGVLGVFAIPIAVSLFASIVLAFPNQTLENYRAVAEAWLFASSPSLIARFWGDVAIVVIALALMSLSIAFCARVLEVAAKADPRNEAPLWQWAYRWAPSVIAVLPIIFAAIGLMNAEALRKTDTGQPIDLTRMIEEVRQVDPRYVSDLEAMISWSEQSRVYFMITAGILVVLAVCLVFLFKRAYARARSGVGFYEFTRRPLAAVVTVLVMAVAVGLFLAYPVALPRRLGAIAIFCFFCACLVFALTQLSIWTRLSGFPLIPTIVVFAVIFALLDSNNNHVLRRVDAKGQPVAADSASAPVVAQVPELTDEFLAWYDKRADRTEAHYAQAPYPVYVVAAQGGGLYAATQALMFLIKMQAGCDLFAQHLFAISGVSGGSVGAALFSALAQRIENRPGRCPADVLKPASETVTNMYVDARELLTRDYLAPLVASGLFPDFLQRFLPLPIPEWSRERALERALEAAWKTLPVQSVPNSSAVDGEPNPLQRGIVDSWNPALARPALLLNTTEAGTGRRRLIAPFSIASTGFNSDMRLLPVTPDFDVPLSTAAVASARFPWLTPAAWFWGAAGQDGRRRFSIVDGAYFENSGVATAIDLIERLEGIAQEKNLPIQVHLIVMTSGDFPDSTFNGLQEPLAPIRSLLNTTRARTFATIYLADRRLGVVDPKAPADTAAAKVRRLQRVEIGDFLTPLPLGWRLSEKTVVEIDRRTGLVRHCIPNDRFEQVPLIRAFGSGDCVKLLVLHQLRGDNLDTALEAARARLPEAVRAKIAAAEAPR